LSKGGHLAEKKCHFSSADSDLHLAVGKVIGKEKSGQNI
jgi:hypothetical protein